MPGGGGGPAASASAGHVPGPPAPPALAAGVELLGEYEGSGYRQTPSLLRAGGRTLEVSALLYLVCAALDGRRDLSDVAEMVTARSGRRATAADIAYLVEHKLRPLGVIAGTPEALPATASRPPSRSVGFSVRAPILSRATVCRSAQVLRGLFRPSVVWVVLITFAAIDVWLWRTQDAGRESAALLRHPALLVLVAGLTLAAGAFHELGHATACRYGGAEPGVIGVGIYLIWPVFYNDLDDSYRLNRTGRLRADLGGIYFNVVAMAAMGGAYLVTGFGPLLVAVGVQHLVVLQQFLPFVRLDGYYVVSDVAGVPDLFRRIGPVLSSLVPGRPVSPFVADLKPRARALVTAWVLIAVPLLGALGVLFVARLPGLATAIWSAAGTRTGSLRAALADRAGWSAALDALQLALLLVAPVGIVITAGQAVRARRRGRGRGRVRRARPTR